MELDFRNVPFDASVWDVKRAFSSVLHGDDFSDTSDPKQRPVNFKVELNYGPVGILNNGTGRIVVADRHSAERLLKSTKSNRGLSVVVKDKTLRLYKAHTKPSTGLTKILRKTPYLDPDIEEERETKLIKLDIGLHVDKVQFGVFYRRFEDPPKTPRRFSNEYEIALSNKSAGLLYIEYDHKLIRLQLGDPMTEELAYNLVITFANIRKLAVGLDFGNPFVCFELLTPATIQLERFNRTLTGQEWHDNGKYRQRLDSLNDAHKVVAPYAYHMRIILHEQTDLDKFRELCVVAGLNRPSVVHVEAFRMEFFSSRKLYDAECRLKKFPWPVAFQIEALLRNSLVLTDDLLVHLWKPIEDLCSKYPQHASDTLRMFTEALGNKRPDESIMDCWTRISSTEPKPEPPSLRAGNFLCHHLTVTPTRFLLEGPYVIQSNRVIREYEGYQENFLRVDFRDEDRLQYRWERDTDGTTLLQDRVGTTLKKGLELGGRHFEFLAYSSSALREHAVWFIHPFLHAQRGYINAEKIRQSLGQFSKVIKQPAKFAARMAQAFTATDPSVHISPDQWEEIEDLGEEPYLHTDGVGTISRGLGDMIWEALCRARGDDPDRTIRPSAYQIRFLGYKGMVAIDDQLEGVKMRLRKSMNKFEGPAGDLAAIEIARAFERPNTCYLNRPLIMVLEDRGVDKSVFMKLQEKAIADIHMASDEIGKCRQFFREHSLGPAYRLSYILQFLKAIDMGMQHERCKYILRYPFLDRCMHYGKNSILRNIKHAARIPMPESYLLVGVADEGPAYEAAGYKDVFQLKKGEIFACVQRPEDDEPQYIEGIVTLSRSPVVHPGDVQRVTAIGKPPEEGLCFFRNLKNVVVLPSVGGRSLASMLGGGDLDGDLYAVVKEPTLLPIAHRDPASYEPVGVRELDRESTIEDVCDFVVEYINSDVLGLLSDRHLIIADQSREGTMDKDCMKLAALCSQAVDYPKNGVPVDIHEAPNRLMHYKPDWKKAEDNTPRQTDYYESSRAVGDLFRAVNLLEAPPQAVHTNGNFRPPPLSDSISKALRPIIERSQLEIGLESAYNSDEDVSDMEPLFRRYVDELRYICLSHSLSDSPDDRLTEEEVVMGTIMANCSQHRYRTDRTYRMRAHSEVLVNDIRQKLYVQVDSPDEDRAREGLHKAWLAWDFGMRNPSIFGANSFALIALGSIGNALEALGEVAMKKDRQ